MRVGDVRQTQPTGRVRGTVVEIEWKGPSLVRMIAAQMQSMRYSSNSASRKAARDGPRHDADDDDSAIGLVFAEGIEEADIDAEYAATTALIREFWAKLGIEGAREAMVLPDVGKEVKGMLRKLKQGRQGGVESGGEGWGSGSGGWCRCGQAVYGDIQVQSVIIYAWQGGVGFGGVQQIISSREKTYRCYSIYTIDSKPG